MTITDGALFSWLTKGVWQSVKGLQPRNLSTGYGEFLDLSIESDRGWLDLRSIDRDHIDHEDELHSLGILSDSEKAREWWTPRAGWEIVDLTRVWHGTAIDFILQPAREISFFTRDRYRMAKTPPASILDITEAIEVSSVSTPGAKMVLAADTFVVGVLKVALGDRERAGLLRELRKVDLANWRQSL
jgi:hypothetical protein